MLLREIQPQATPAGPDIQHVKPGPQQQLRRDVPFLEDLRFIQGFGARGEIGAGILPVGIEKEIVEIARQVIVVRHIGARAVDRIVMQPANAQRIQPGPDPPPGHVIHGVEIGHADRQKIAQAAGFDAQRSIHIGLAKRQAGIGQQPPGQPGVGYADGDGRAVAGAEDPFLAIRVDQRQATGAHQVAQRLGEQPHRHASGWKPQTAAALFKAGVVRGFTVGHVSAPVLNWDGGDIRLKMTSLAPKASCNRRQILLMITGQRGPRAQRKVPGPGKASVAVASCYFVHTTVAKAVFRIC